MEKKFTSDIDIDCADRDQVLRLIHARPAAIDRDGKRVKHNTGVYATDIPRDPATGWSALDHHVAEERGYAKLDLLNVGVYQQVKSEQHLVELMREPDWTRLNNKEFCEQVSHIGAHYNTIQRMPEPIDSIPRLAMFLAVIRPAKRHLIGKPWATVAKTIWDKDNSGYSFKKSHAVSYAHLVVVHMNLLCENANR